MSGLPGEGNLPPRSKTAPCLFWLLAVCGFVSRTNARYRFDKWTIRAICQTSDGYFWLATFDGLVRFDGVRFTVVNRSNSPGIHSNRFTSLDEDMHGGLWLGTGINKC